MTESKEQTKVDANEVALVKALKTYYKLCCESKEKAMLIKVNKSFTNQPD